MLQIRAVQKIGQVTHPALPVEQDASEMPVPPGYQGVSLVEALNGPIVTANPAPAAPPVAVALQNNSEKKNRKRSSKSRQQSSRQVGAFPELTRAGKFKPPLLSVGVGDDRGWTVDVAAAASFFVDCGAHRGSGGGGGHD